MKTTWIFGGVAICGLAAGLFLVGCAASSLHTARGYDYVNAAAISAPRDGTPRYNFQAFNPTNASSPDEVWVVPRNSAAFLTEGPGSGALLARVEDYEMPMPLKHTDVKASVDGYIGTVDVTQQFENHYTKTINVAYVFLPPRNAAVHDFVMTIGKRHIRGIIRERKEAEAIYEEAKRQGYRATLLTEERPNVFKQSVANIEPGAAIDVNLQYIQTLNYANGWYEFIFPMVTESNSRPPGNSEWDGHDFSLRVDVKAGVPVEELECKTHAIVKTVLSTNHFVVQLAPNNRIPNKDFVLRYRVAGDQIRSSLITHRDERGGYFTLTLYPPKEVENPVHPALTHIQLDGGAMQVFDVFPRQIPDLLYGRAVMLTGRFSGGGANTIRVTADAENGPVEFEVSASKGAPSGLPNIWARMKIQDLVEQSAYAPNSQLPHQINQVALDYGLVSPFTGFVTVDAGGE